MIKYEGLRPGDIVTVKTIHGQRRCRLLYETSIGWMAESLKRVSMNDGTKRGTMEVVTSRNFVRATR